MKHSRRSLAMLGLAPVAFTLCLVLFGCSRSSDGVVTSSALDCSDKAIAASAHPMQLKMDCAAQKHARSQEFQRTHDCTLSFAARQPNPDEYYAQCQGETWDGKHSDIWKQIGAGAQEMPKAQSGILGAPTSNGASQSRKHAKPSGQ